MSRIDEIRERFEEAKRKGLADTPHVREYQYLLERCEKLEGALRGMIRKMPGFDGEEIHRDVQSMIAEEALKEE